MPCRLVEQVADDPHDGLIDNRLRRDKAYSSPRCRVIAVVAYARSRVTWANLFRRVAYADRAGELGNGDCYSHRVLAFGAASPRPLPRTSTDVP